MKSLLLLDLEQTLINDWDDFVAIQVDKVCKFVAPTKWSAVGLYSFAVWDDADLDRFKLNSSYLEEKFNLKFSPDWLFHMEDVKKLVAKHTKQRYPSEEFRWQWSKEWSLLTIVKDTRFHNMDVTLLDDEVRNMVVELPDTNTRLSFVNVKTL